MADRASAESAELTWRRIASGLFQPLGLKIVDGKIYVSVSAQNGAADEAAADAQVEDGFDAPAADDQLADDEFADAPPREADSLKEIRIDLVEFANIKLIDKTTGNESQLGRLAVKDFHYLDGEFQSVAVAEIDKLVTTGENLEVTDLSGSTDSA